MPALGLNPKPIGRLSGLQAGWAIRRSGLSNNQAVNLATAAGLIVFLGLLGWLLAEGRLELLIVAVAVMAVGWFALAERGALIGLLLLASMNGIPKLDMSRYLINHFTAQDLAVMSLLLICSVWALFGTAPARTTRAARMLAVSGALLLTWCLFTICRTIVAEHVGVLTAVAFARDYLYFGALLMVLPRVRLSARDITALVATVTVGVCFYAVVQIGIALGFGAPGTLIHVDHTLQQDGLRRVYSNMTDLVIAGLTLSLAASLLAREGLLRRVARPVAVLLTISVVVQLTRARWVGVIVAVLVVTAWLTLQRDRDGDASLLRRRVLAVIAIACLILTAVAILDPGALSGGPFSGRLTSIFSDVESKTGTVAVRQTVSAQMTRYLGAHWLEGLGFLSPAAHYFQGVPHGSIEDPDLGVLNAVMPMGVIGAALIYLPVVLIAIQCLRASAGPSRYAWLRYGGALWAVATVVSSVTLVTLFSTNGLALTAVLLSLLAGGDVLGTSLLRESERAYAHPRLPRSRLATAASAEPR